MFKKKKVENCGSDTFAGRPFDVSKDNTQFTTDDIFAETATLLTGVRIFHLVLYTTKYTLL